METSILENENNYEITPKNFLVTKNIPLDKRFVISSITKLDTELPFKRRYPGLLIFVIDSIINDGIDDVYVGEYYMFENDVTTPISLRHLFGRYDIKTVSPTITDDVYSYENILTSLNKTFAEAGSIRYILVLGIAVIYDGTTWNYLCGKYILNNDTEYNTIPDIFKSPKSLVYCKDSDTTKIILTDLSLSTLIIECTEIPEIINDYMYYLMNGYLYIGLLNTLYALDEKLYIATNLTEGVNQIVHNLNSNNINCKFKINNEDTNNPFIETGLVIQPDFIIVDENTITITTIHEFTGTLFIQGKNS